MSEPNLGSIQASCETILSGLPSKLSWSWDDRFKAVLLQMESSQAALLHELLEKQFPTSWGSKSVKEAPSTLREVVKSLGGLQSSQELFATNPDDSVLLVAAWWPWQGGARISLRFLLRTSAASKADLDLKLQSWFGL